MVILCEIVQPSNQVFPANRVNVMPYFRLFNYHFVFFKFIIINLTMRIGRTNLIIRASVPQQRLLEQVDVFITHAGMNSVNEALCCGVPMALLPHQIEQRMIAKRVEKMGAGISLQIKRVTPAKLYGATQQLLSDPKHKQQAVKYSNLFKEEEEDSHIRAADEILHHLRSQ